MGHDPLLFSISGTGSLYMHSSTGTAVHTKPFDYSVMGH